MARLPRESASGPIANIERFRAQMEAADRVIDQLRSKDSGLQEAIRKAQILTSTPSFVEQARRIDQATRSIRNMQTDVTASQALQDQFAVAGSHHNSLRELVSRVDEQMTTFRLGNAEEVMQQIAAFKMPDSIQHHIDRARFTESVLSHALSMSSPWVNSERVAASVTSFAEVHLVGTALRELPPFDLQLEAFLRDELGDWRVEVEWGQFDLVDPISRLNLYHERGFKRAPISTPEDALAEELAGASEQLSEFLSQAGEGGFTDEEEELFARNNQYHDWTQRFETKLRRFIDAKMTEAFGEDWPNRKLDPEILKDWKKKRARRPGESRLINYAAFTHYERVITTDENWSVVFSEYFVRRESVLESLQRLNPMRVAVMHSGTTFQEDHILVVAEITRLSRAMAGR